jgi:hypothetical protein
MPLLNTPSGLARTTLSIITLALGALVSLARATNSRRGENAYNCAGHGNRCGIDIQT